MEGEHAERTEKLRLCEPFEIKVKLITGFEKVSEVKAGNFLFCCAKAW